MVDGVLGIDIGGSGSRASAGGMVLTGRGVTVGAGGSDAATVAEELLARVDVGEVSAVGFSAVGFSVTGLATVVPDPSAFRALVARRFGPVPVVLATDGLAAQVGALGGAAGAVVAAGTGTIAIGTDLEGIWARVDGWGHLLGDDGGGAAIGMAALRIAIAQHDGRRSDGARLLALARDRFGDPETWPAQLYTRDDRAGVLAGFVPDVALAAAGGDPAATSVLRSAGRALATTLHAALVPGLPRVASYTGGIFSAGESLRAAFRDELVRLGGPIDLREPLGGPLDGAVRLAAMAAERADRFVARPSFFA